MTRSRTIGTLVLAAALPATGGAFAARISLSHTRHESTSFQSLSPRLAMADDPVAPVEFLLEPDATNASTDSGDLRFAIAWRNDTDRPLTYAANMTVYSDLDQPVATDTALNVKALNARSRGRATEITNGPVVISGASLPDGYYYAELAVAARNGDARGISNFSSRQHFVIEGKRAQPMEFNDWVVVARTGVGKLVRAAEAFDPATPPETRGQQMGGSK